MRLATCNCPLATHTKTPVPPKMGGRGCLREYSTRGIYQKGADEPLQKRYQRTASFRPLPALKTGTFIAGMLIFWLGLRGLTPVRAARLLTRKVPKPVMVIEPPFLRVPVMRLMRPSNMAAAATLETPAASASCAMISAFVIGMKREKKKKDGAILRLRLGARQVFWPVFAKK